MTKFEKDLIKMVGTDLKHWYEFELDYNLIVEMSDKTKQKFGRVAEKAVELLTGSQKAHIKDFLEGEIKTVSLTDGSKEFIKDKNGNLLAYRWSTDEPYMKLKPYGDNFIQVYSDELTWSNFRIKIETMYFIFYEKYQPEGVDKVDEAKVVNILKFKSEWYKNLEKEFRLIQQVANSVDLENKSVCDKAQTYIRESNELLVMKRFKNGNKFEWHLFFKDKEVIKYGEFLVDYKNVKCVEDGDEALEHVYDIASNGNPSVLKNLYDKQYKLLENLLSKVEKEEKEKIFVKNNTIQKVKKEPKKEPEIELIKNIKVQLNEKQSQIYRLANELSSNELTEIIGLLSILNYKKTSF